MAEQQMKSGFTPFISTSYDRQQLKRMLMLDIDDLDNEAGNLVPHMKLLFSQSAYFFNPYENEQLQLGIEDTARCANAFINSIEQDDENYAHYRSKLVNRATDFLLQWSELALKHKLTDSIEVDKAATPFDMLKSVLDIDGYRDNKYGFPISYQQRLIAEFALQRTRSKYDLIMLVVGKRGRGKSTFTAEEVSTFLELQGKEFGLDQVMITESREQMFNEVKTWKPGEGHILDEAINQLFSRDFFKGGDFISLLTEIRYKRTFTCFLIPELFQIDKIVRESLADLVVQITERGMAIVSAPSLLSGEDKYMQEKPDAPILTPQAHTEFMLKKSLNSIVACPFRTIPDGNQYWTQYESIKNDKVLARKFIKPIIKKTALKSDDYYYQLAVMTANSGLFSINEKYVTDYASRVSYNLTLLGFAKWICKNTGLKVFNIVVTRVGGDLLKLDNPIVSSYFKKMAMQQVKA